MAEFVDWSAGGGDGEVDETDGGFGAVGTSKPMVERDAVLFAIDCRKAMFVRDHHSGDESSAIAGAAVGGGDTTTATAPGTAAGGVPSSSSPTTVGATPFSRAVRSALQFYQDKVETSEKDLVGVVLFGCREKVNPFDFPNLYIFHDIDTPSAPRVQELELLSKGGEFTGNQPAFVARDFHRHIGSLDLPPPTTTTTSAGGSVTTATMAFSEVLWAAQHLFRHLPVKNVTFKRVFLFTADDNPPGTSTVERQKCFARMRDLAESGVTLEIFAGGMVAPGASAATASSSTGTFLRPPGAGGGGVGTTPSSDISTSMPLMHHPVGTSPPRDPHQHTPSSVDGGGSTMSTAGTRRTAAAPVATAAPPGGTTATAPRHFDPGQFWHHLLSVNKKGSSLPFGSSLDSPPFLASLDEGGDDYVGSVHLPSKTGDDPFEVLLSEVRLRTFPQRSNGTLGMAVGVGVGAPRVPVGVYLPSMRCKKPRFVWLESSTNALISSETHHLDPETGAEITESDILHEGKVGGSTVKFTAPEVKEMKAQFDVTGLTLIAFKDSKDVLKAKHSINRSAFLHPKTQDPNELKLFVGLHRVLLKQQKVAIASLIPRAGAPPRLVALQPSSEDIEVPDSVIGAGFHVIYLPYADDVRSLKFEQFPKPSDEAVHKAKRVIKKLSVDYDPSAIGNPAVQEQFQLLQRLALMNPMSAAQKPPDYSLPDAEGMSKYTDLFADFSSEVYTPGYNPELVITATKTKPPPTADELKAVDFDGLETAGNLASLTVAVLKAFLKACGEETGGLKAELVDRAGHVVRKRRDGTGSAKRPRED